MPLDIAITIDAPGMAALQNMREMPNALGGALVEGLNVGVKLMLSRTLATRYTGSGPFPVADHRLGIVTGRLRGSIQRYPAKSDADGAEASVGSNVIYWQVHEYGSNKTVTVKSHKRVNLYDDEQGFRVSKGRAQRTKRRIIGFEVEVTSHSRRMNIPARAPLRTGFEENKGLLSQALSASLVRAWTKNKTRSGGYQG